MPKCFMRTALLVLWAYALPCTPAHAAELTFDLRVTGGHVPENMRLIRVHQGDLVKLRWSADRPMALHLHGYDVEQTVAPGAVSDMVFSARIAGRFQLFIVTPDRRGGHSHAEQPLVTVEVQPR
jgi:hypothetical protein